MVVQSMLDTRSGTAQPVHVQQESCTFRSGVQVIGKWCQEEAVNFSKIAKPIDRPSAQTIALTEDFNTNHLHHNAGYNSAMEVRVSLTDLISSLFARR